MQYTVVETDTQHGVRLVPKIDIRAWRYDEVSGRISDILQIEAMAAREPLYLTHRPQLGFQHVVLEGDSKVRLTMLESIQPNSVFDGTVIFADMESFSMSRCTGFRGRPTARPFEQQRQPGTFAVAGRLRTTFFSGSCAGQKSERPPLQCRHLQVLCLQVRRHLPVPLILPLYHVTALVRLSLKAPGWVLWGESSGGECVRREARVKIRFKPKS